MRTCQAFILIFIFIGCEKESSITLQPILPVSGNYLPLNKGTIRTYHNKNTSIKEDTTSEIILGDSAIYGRIYKNRRIGFSRAEPIFCKEGNNYFEVYYWNGFYQELLILKDNRAINTSWEDKLDFSGSEKITHKVVEVNINKLVNKQNFKNVIHIKSVQVSADLIVNTIDSYFAKDIGLIYRCSVPNRPDYFESSIINYDIK